MKTHLGDDMPLMPWMINTESNKPALQFDAAFAHTRLDYLCNLDVESKIGRSLLTSVACMIGSNNSEVKFIESLMDNSATIFCVDMSRGSLDEQRALLERINVAVQNYHKISGRIHPFAIALELTGLRIRTGHLETYSVPNVVLEENEIVELTVNTEYACHCSKKVIYVNNPDILKILKLEDKLYIDYGNIILEVCQLGRRKKFIKCKVINSGILRNEAIVHLPDIPQEFSEVIQSELLGFALENKVDILIISRVRCAHTIENIREVLQNSVDGSGRCIVIISKIEDAVGVKNIDEIIEISDGIIIARGELGIEMPPEKLFLVQKMIIAKCNKAGKPVICATHLLRSLSKSHMPDRADMLDVANCVLDGADCLLLSEEIIDGPHPDEALTLLKQICMEAEAAAYQKQLFSNLTAHMPFPIQPPYSIGVEAVDASMKCKASCIIVLTVSGRSAKLIAQYRPQCPIIAVTRFGHVARELNLWRAVIPLQFIAPPRGDWHKDVDLRFQYAVTFGKVSGIIKGGDCLIMVSAWRQGTGFTNTVRIVYASQNNCISIRSVK